MAKHTVIQHRVVVESDKRGSKHGFRCSCGYKKQAYNKQQATEKAIVHINDMLSIGGE